jgi:hypothetical protein
MRVQYGYLPEQFVAWVPLLPMRAGMLIGAPLLAREYEHGTWQLVWTQGATRAWWLAAKLALVLGTVLAVSLAFGILAGAVVRRTIVAAAITVGGYLLVRIPVEFLVRPRFRDPVTTDDLAEASSGWIVGNQIGGGSGDLVQYHPSDHFWQFQLIDTVILLVVTIVLLTVTWRLVLGRKSPTDGSHREPVPVPA